MKIKTIIITILGLVLFSDFAMAQRAGKGTRTTINEKKTEESQRARRGLPNTSTEISQIRSEARLESRITQIANNSRNLLQSVDGLVRLSKANPSQKLPELIDTIVQRKQDLESATREIDVARKEVLDSVLRTLENAAKEIQNSEVLASAKKEDLNLLVEFLQNYVVQAVAKESNWNGPSTNNLNAFLQAVSRGIPQGKSLEQIVTEHGKFTYREFKERCRTAETT